MFHSNCPLRKTSLALSSNLFLLPLKYLQNKLLKLATDYKQAEANSICTMSRKSGPHSFTLNLTRMAIQFPLSPTPSPSTVINLKSHIQWTASFFSSCDFLLLGLSDCLPSRLWRTHALLTYRLGIRQRDTIKRQWWVPPSSAHKSTMETGPGEEREKRKWYSVAASFWNEK